MNLPKLDSLLNLSLSLPDQSRRKSAALSAAASAAASTAFSPTVSSAASKNNDSRWTVVVLTSGDISSLSLTHPQISVTPLREGFAIVTLPPQQIAFLASLPEVLYVEMPKLLSFAQASGLPASCILPVLQPPLSLTGQGVLVGIIDSGIDLFHPAFRNQDGSTRVVSLWDQDGPGPAPIGYSFGTEYTSGEIDAALTDNILLSQDRSGHGTAVAGIACGSRSPENGFQGVAPQAQLIVVKLQVTANAGPSTPAFMEAIRYCVEKSLQQNQPLALNLSYGMNYGSHTGTSLLEVYLNRISLLGQISIVAAAGNEGASPIHFSGRLSSAQEIPLSIGPYQPSLSLQLWTDSSDLFSAVLISPSGQQLELPTASGAASFLADQTQIAVFHAEPTPYQRLCEYLLEWIPLQDYVTSGIWRLRLVPTEIRNGSYEMWLSGSVTLNRSTRFLYPSPDNTLTIPATSGAVISAGAYDSATDSPAAFSGRGPRNMPPLLIKPDLVAPGVNVLAPASPDTYQLFTGTSFSAPYVTGCCALLMEWGILRGNSPFLYGEKLKACLLSGARQLPGFSTPNEQTGWGTLCLENSILWL